jgi:hypothetical protein
MGVFRPIWVHFEFCFGHAWRRIARAVARRPGSTWWGSILRSAQRAATGVAMPSAAMRRGKRHPHAPKKTPWRPATPSKRRDHLTVAARAPIG